MMPSRSCRFSIPTCSSTILRRAYIRLSDSSAVICTPPPPSPLRMLVELSTGLAVGTASQPSRIPGGANQANVREAPLEDGTAARDRTEDLRIHNPTL